jgi:ribonuclease P protein component
LASGNLAAPLNGGEKDGRYRLSGFRLKIWVSDNETHISAKHNQARTHARVSRSYGYQGRPPRIEAPPREGSRQTNAVRTPLAITAADKIPQTAGSSPYRFRKENRLLDAAAYSRVFKRASRSRDGLFTVLCRGNDGNVARLGLAISKKNCRAATARNRIKRIVRESVRMNQAKLEGLDIVVMNQPAARNSNNRQIFDSLHGHWQQCARAHEEEQD